MTTENVWRNRIVGHSEEDPREMVAHPNNWKLHTATQRAALVSSIDQIGFVRSITVDRETKTIVDGHERVALAIEQGQETIPVEWVELSEDEMRQALVSIDAIAWMADVERRELRALMDANMIGDSPELLRYLAKLAPEEPEAPEEFTDLSGGAETEHVCPKCGYEF